MSLQGAVVFIDGDNVARGTKLDYRIADKTYYLFGPKAVVISPRGIMTAADSITYNNSDIENKEVLAFGAASCWGDNGRIIEGERIVAFLDGEGAIQTVTAEGTQNVTLKGIVAAARLIMSQLQTVQTCLVMLKLLIATTFCGISSRSRI